MPARVAMLAVALLLAAARPGAAEPEVPPPPRAPHVLHVPTAWLQPRDGFFGSGGVTHRKGSFLRITAGLGDLADVDVGVADSFEGTRVGTAGIKIGVATGVQGQPALAVGIRRSFVGLEVAELTAIASGELGPVRGHAGAQLWAATRLDATVRPFAGVEWRPSLYPRTTVLADFSWAPVDDEVRWIGGWGIRYQALSWGSIELAVRHRQGEELDGSTVMVRVNGVLQFSKQASEPP